ncbi:MAG: DUF2721 domain-containing protein [Candidatus Pacebacteria bacterium]|nr:DUF2721 domain-containing protein [Candidatus Paceibacterota bacterium]
MLTTEIISALQLAIGPVILISAVGLLLLTLNNRLSASINRARVLCTARDTAVSDSIRVGIEEQLSVIWRRANLLRTSIVWMVGSALFSCILVIALFVQVVVGVGAHYITGALFVGSLCCIIVGLVFFIQETRQVLVALGLEIGVLQSQKHFEHHP